jgi:uncharacterized protein YbjT (DUF2867 family)
MRILILGAYGLIGAAVMRRLCGADHTVIGLGRDIRAAARTWPQVAWILADISRLKTPEMWSAILRESDADAIVNCAGALQDGTRDDVTALQHIAMCALYAACPSHGIGRFVQVSATRAAPDAETVFQRTKGDADAALRATTLEWTILRPGLVIAPQAYGGTGLLRALAAFPLVQPLAFADRPVQTVDVDDVAGAVAKVLSGVVASRRTYDLVEDAPRPQREVVAKLRAWLGSAPAPEILVPRSIIAAMGRVADGLGWLGWRSPMRTTALTEMAAGVVGDPAAWRAETNAGLSSLDETLRRLPSTVQERWFSRLYLLKPTVIVTLSAFWIVSGLVALAAPETASAILTSRGIDHRLASAAVIGGAIADIALGAAILVRRWLVTAALGMIGLTLVYLAAGTLLAPDLWADPLGPLVKTMPALILALVAIAMAEDR